MMSFKLMSEKLEKYLSYPLKTHGNSSSSSCSFTTVSVSTRPQNDNCLLTTVSTSDSAEATRPKDPAEGGC